MKALLKYWHKAENGLQTLLKKELFYWLGLLLFVILNVYFKFGMLDEMHLKNDDGFSVFYAQQTLPEMYAQLEEEANPPFYFTLLHFWIGLFGIGSVAVKSLSVVFSVGTAIVLYFIFKKNNNTLGACLASCLFLFINLHFQFAYEVRAFSLVTFLSSLSIYFFLKLLETPKTKWLLIFTLVNAALPYSHYTSVLVPITEFLILIPLLFTKRNVFFRLGTSFVFSALLFIPQLANFSSTIPDDDFWLSKPNMNDFHYVLEKLSGLNASHNTIFLLLGAGVLLSLIHLFYSVFHEKNGAQKLLLFIALYFVPIVLNYFLAQYTPVFRLRYMLFANLGVILALSYLFSQLKLPKLILLLSSLFLLRPFFNEFQPQNENIFQWDVVAQKVKQDYNPDYDYFIHPSWRLQDFTYYYDRESFADYKNLDNRMKASNFFCIYSAGQLAEFQRNRPIVFIRRNLPDSEFTKGMANEFKKLLYSKKKEFYKDQEIIVELWSK